MNEERLYINGFEIDLQGQAIAKTLQVNDIGNIADRQTNFTRTINIPKTPNNIIAFDYLGIIGSNSNVPYQRNSAKYFYGNEALIYDGWANVTESNSSYNTVIYDGIIDFYKAIENKFITDVGVSDLNHLKTVDSILHSWTGDTSYRYLIADYNGKKTYMPTGTTDTVINVDYLIPSASVKYIWDRIFDYFDFEYEGSVFNTLDFTNLWLTYPKPVPTIAPHRILINAQSCFPSGYTVHYYEGYVLLERTDYVISIFRENFSSAYAEITTVGSTFTTTQGDVIPSERYISILQNGTYSIDVDFDLTDISYLVKDASNSIVENGFLELDDTGLRAFKILNLLAGQKLYVYNSIQNITASYDFTFNKIDGYEVNFEEVFIDLKVKDFINEILQRFSLTMFPSKYGNKLSFLTTSEWLQTSNVIDWSNKFSNLVNTKYALNGYCQNNRFKYKYNDENSMYNDGIISIDNVNLPDEKIIISSSFYSPEKDKIKFLDMNSNVYKFWNKEVKDSGEVEYKPLDNRFYLLRSENYNFNGTVKLGSENLNVVTTISNCRKENYSGLRFQEIINNYYLPIKSILNTSKIFSVDLNLTVKDVNDFDFRQLIYIDQLATYCMVNKISNFIPNKLTRCELIEVDYQSSYTPTPPVELAVGLLNIDNLTVDGCEIVFTFSTDAPIGTPVNINCQPNSFGLPVLTPIDPMYIYSDVYYTTGITNTISFTLNAGTYYQLQLSVNNVENATFYSNAYGFENAATCTISSPTGVTITDVNYISTGLLTKRYRIDFTTDAVLPRTVYYADYKTPVPIDPSNPYGGSFGGWSEYSEIIATTNHFETDISTFAGNPLKVRLRIGTTVSNEFTI